MNNGLLLVTVQMWLLVSANVVAQDNPNAAEVRRPVANSQEPATPNSPKPDDANSGKTLFSVTCSFCHGANARGGEGGPDLLHSVVVLDDEGGTQLSSFLKKGRPEKGMPAFPSLSEQQATQIASYLHQQITSAVSQRKVQNVLTGDAKAGQDFFNGVGKCNSCHSVDGDLKGISAKYDLLTLQDKIVIPRNQGLFGRPPGGIRPSVSVKLPSGDRVEGELIDISEFDVTMLGPDGVQRTFARNGDSPEVVIKDPLQSHVDMLAKITDKNIHDLTAYLSTIK